jgi:hypothetical protein
MTTPWQVVDEHREAVFWSFSRYDWNSKVSVMMQDAYGAIEEIESVTTEVSSPDLAPMNDLNQPGVDLASYWIKYRVEIPSSAVAIRLRMSDTSSEATDWLAVTELIEPVETDLRALYDAETDATYVEPSLLMFTPCVNEPDINAGIVEPVGLVLGQRTWAFGYLHFEHTWVEVGCKEIEELNLVCAYLIQ